MSQYTTADKDTGFTWTDASGTRHIWEVTAPLSWPAGATGGNLGNQTVSTATNVDMNIDWFGMATNAGASQPINIHRPDAASSGIGCTSAVDQSLTRRPTATTRSAVNMSGYNANSYITLLYVPL